MSVMCQICNLDRLRAMRSQAPTIADLAALEQSLLVAAAADAGTDGIDTFLRLVSQHRLPSVIDVGQNGTIAPYPGETRYRAM